MRGLALALSLLAGAASAQEYPDAERVLSLGGSVTEIIYALGQQDRLAGRDQTSSWPPEAMELPDIGYVRAISPEGALSTSPDLIIAEEGAGPPEAIAVLQSAGIPYVTVAEGYDAEAVLRKLHAVAAALGVPEQGRELGARIEAELAEVASRTATITTPRKAMFVLSLQDGRIMASGAETSADGIIRMAGAKNALAGFTGYKNVTPEAIIEAAPDVVLMMQRGNSDMDSEHGASRAAALAIPAIAQTPAGRDEAIVVMDGLKLLGFGPRTGEAALELHGLIYGNGDDDGGA